MMDLKYREYGTVRAVSGCIAKVKDLQNCFLGQLIHLGYGTDGIIMGCDLNVAQVLIVKETEPITPGTRVVATLEPFNMPVGNETVGRIINPLGESLDGLGPVSFSGSIPYFNQAPAIMDRVGLSRTFETGIKLIDTMLPLGKGQRSLVLGDKMTGKTTVGMDIILNQRGKDVICIYCGIGKTKSSTSRVIDFLKENECFDHTLLVLAPASSSPGLQYLAPYAACSVGEHFMYQGKDVFIFFDDFTKHAWAYRELSLLMEVPPGRDSYPGDVFYLHSRMIERAAQLKPELKGGSMTFIPVVELLEGDITAYVPTNLISMTDGQLYLSTNLFNEGFRPAVDVGLSVSRVGNRVQWKAMKTVSKSLRMEFIQFKELLKASKLSAGNQSEQAREAITQGKKLQALLTQPSGKPVSQEIQIMFFFAKDQRMFKNVSQEDFDKFLESFEAYARQTDSQVLDLMRSSRELNDEIRKRITKLVSDSLRIIQNQNPEFRKKEAEAPAAQPPAAAAVEGTSSAEPQ